MNSNNHSKPISLKNNKPFIILLIIPTVVLMIVFFAIMIKCNQASSKADAIDGKANDIQEHADLTINYASAKSGYESAVTLFNSEAKSFNDFLNEIKKYNLIENDTPIEIIEEKNNDDSTEINKEKTEAILRETDSIKANTKAINEKHTQLSKDIITALVTEYNTQADEYNETVKAVIVDYIEGIQTEISKKEITDYEVDSTNSISQIETIISDIRDLTDNSQIISHLKAPSIEWVIARLRKCGSISDAQRVTPDNDPDGLLGKEGSYINCEYFSVRSLASENMTGAQIVEAGTDIGGAIEIYATKEDALNRCDYLSQFDDTYLVSGSYTVVGTMVIRTSYKLSNEEQVNLTNEIITALTELGTQEQ